MLIEVPAEPALQAALAANPGVLTPGGTGRIRAKPSIHFTNMAARNRPRGGLTKDDATDAHEERNMWSQIVTDIKRLRTTHAKAAEIAKAQVDMEAKIGKSQ